VGMVVFLALGRVPEIEDEPEAIPGPGSTEPAGVGPTVAGPAPRQSSPASTTVPAPDAPASTSETP
jgi:hypothetical protein